MRWEDIEKQFDFDIPVDEPLFPLNIVCELVQIQYHTLHEILKEGIISEVKKKKNNKLLSVKDVKRLKYVKYLMEKRGVNIQGIKVIFEIEEE